MTHAEVQIKLREASEHLQKGRFRLALGITSELILLQPEDFETVIYHAWALLDNNNAMQALEYINKSFDLPNNSVIAQMYRGYLQMRLSLFEASVYDFNMTQDRQKEYLALSYYHKARALAGIGEFERAMSTFELALMIDRGVHPEWSKTKKYLTKAQKFIKEKIAPDNNMKEYIDLAVRAAGEKEYWFTLLVAGELGGVVSDDQTELELLELEAMFRLNQFQPCKSRLEELQQKYPENERVKNISQALEKITSASVNSNRQTGCVPQKMTDNRYRFNSFQNTFTEIKSMGVFDATRKNENRQLLNEMKAAEVKKIGLAVNGSNPFYTKEDKSYNYFIVWYLDDEVIGQNGFNITISKDWDAFEFEDFCDVAGSRFWGEGCARVELYINKVKAGEKYFIASQQSVPDETLEIIESKQSESEEKIEEEFSLEQVLEELDQNIGLSSIKTGVRELIDYLEFMKERKQVGLKAQDKVVINATFLGNPGTGKTTIARLMGKIFKGMGILPKSDVIEVDRAGLVGQYIGETAQKTEKVIESAIGAVLFIDEAYTLAKGGGGNDFGQEAIDTLLKRMEDRKGEFALIVAGYPKEMEAFLTSNPGIKSRMTHNFNFEDYTPDEMLQIFNKMLSNEDYRIAREAEQLLLKHFTDLYRARDKNFGNARTVRRYFDDAKVTLSKRYLKIPKHLRTKDKLMTITEEDVREIFAEAAPSAADIPINEEALAAALAELEKLTGLGSVKTDVREMVKLARYYKSNNDSLADKLSAHVLFLGNPGTGKTTVARILGRIYSALGVLPKGHLVETDRQGLVATHIGGTAEKTASVINQSIGGTLFIDEAYSLARGGDSGSDFGKGAIDTLLKRMEDDRGKFIVVAAGYTEEMKAFIESNPGMKSRFTKIFTFEDYTPDELMLIAGQIARNRAMKFDDDIRNRILRHFNELYRSRDKNFGNARIVRNLMDGAIRRQILRLSELPPDSITAEMRSQFTADDFEELQQKVKAAVRPTVAGDADKLEKYIRELRQLTGMESVKDSVEKLINSLRIANTRKERGMQVVEKPLHSVFTGNPGTGKTTVARLMSNIFKELGILEKGHLVEVDRAQLVAGYQGQTAAKTDSIISKALGGTLFIDEAYTLSRGASDFGQEAIDTLLKRMEDYRGQFIVIVAGYPNEMQVFLDSNPGLSSRFTKTFYFEDYNPTQLTGICLGMAASNGYTFSDEGKKALLEKFAEIYGARDKNFGNARTARNLLMDIITKQEDRIAGIISPTDEQLQILTPADIL